MKLFSGTLLTFAASLALAAHSHAKTIGSGKLATETRAVSGFHGVELDSGGTLEITQGDKEELIVEAEDNLLPLLETTVKADGTLRLTFKHGEEIHTTKPVKFKLSARTMDKIVLAGSGGIHVVGKLSAESETIKLPGSGDITVDQLETGMLTTTLAGSGTIKIAGAASGQNVQLAGSGDYVATGLKTDLTKISVYGSGECKVWAEKKLEVQIAGSGEVVYSGHPEVIQRISGSGEVRPAGA